MRIVGKGTMRPMSALLHNGEMVLSVWDGFCDGTRRLGSIGEKPWTSTSQGSDWLTIPHYRGTRKANRGARHGPCRTQTENHQARQSYKKAHKENCTSIRDRFMKGPASRASQLKMNWTEEPCFEIYEEQVAVRES